MLFTLIALLTVATLIFVVLPMMRKEFIPFGAESDHEMLFRSLMRKKQKLYGDIKDLDFEYGIGKMAPDDYQRLRRESLDEVTEVIKSIDGLSHGGNGKVTDTFIEQLISAKRQTPSAQISLCPGCGKPVSSAAKFCPECGAKLSPKL